MALAGGPKRRLGGPIKKNGRILKKEIFFLRMKVLCPTHGGLGSEYIYIESPPYGDRSEGSHTGRIGGNRGIK